MSSRCVLRNPSDRCFERFRRGGDPRHLAAVFDRTAPEVWRVAAHLCRDRHDAEDAVQGTFLAAIEHRDDWDAARPVLPWLLGLLVNRVREQRRRAARMVDAARLAPERCDDPAENATRSEFGAAFAASLQRLDEPFRSLLEQHLVHGKKAHEIAAQTGEAAGAVRVRIHRGLDRLRRQLPRTGFATGAVALQMPPSAFARARATVLARIPGGSAIPVSASFGVLGMLTLPKALLAGAAAITLACVACLWPSSTNAPMPVVANAASAPAVQPLANRDATSTDGVATGSAPAERTAAAAAPARGTLRIVVRTAWNDAPIPNTGLEVAYGLTAGAGSQPAAGDLPAPSTVVAKSVRDVASGSMTSTTDDIGVARLELPVGRARIRVPAFAASPTVVADVRADVETECRIAIPAEFSAVVRVTDGDRPIAGARLLGRAAGERGLVERELGTTDDAGCWSAAFADRYVTLRAVARGRAASAPVVLEKDNHDVSLRIGGEAAVVTGVVFGSDGAPLANAEVLLHAREASTYVAPIAVRTSATGAFTCDYVPPGPCLVLAARQLESGQRRFTMRDVAATAGTPATIELRLPAGARLAAKLSRANGDEGGHCNITLAPLHRQLPRSLRSLLFAGADTNARGECVLDGLFPGPYELHVSPTANAPSTLELRDGETREVVATLDAIEWLEVEVVDEAGSPLAGWHVAVDDAARRGDGQTLAAKGRVRFERLAPGAHEVTLRRERGGLPMLTRSVPSNQRTRLVVPKETRTLHVVRGTVAPSAGIELRDLKVVLMSTLARAPLEPSAQTETTVDATSRAFAFASVPAGTYHLMIVSRHRLWALRFHLQVGGNDLDLGEIELGCGTLELQLTRGDGQPVREPVLGIDLGDGSFFLGAAAAPDGLVRELPAALYRLLAWGRDVEPVVVPATVRVGERTAIPVTLRAATPTSLGFTGLAAQQAQFATIKLHRDGAPLLAVLVDASQPFVRGLMPGAYRVEVATGDGAHGTADFRVTTDPG
ncbi:MAG TPA: sigma-70 family RNA polymerase sigma factor, partial [Planctomycetota bacterium]|nr:sigma-70 family RNA polymerase sigma factor [Planctomycetota bacterium]